MVEFAGYNMPIQYEGIIAEHKAVREAVGVFDVSHMGEFEVSGKDAAAFVQKMTTNDVGKLHEGRIQYSAMCYDDGGIVDDLLVYHCGEYFMLVVNASNLQKDFDWLKSHIEGDVQLIDKSDNTSLLAVQGPKSLDVVNAIADVDLSGVEYYHYVRGKVAGVPCLISRTGYTGEFGFELYFESSPEAGKKVWDALFEAGKPHGIKPVGLGARDTLRLEVGFCLYGNDIDKSTNPLEAGLGWITKLKASDFIGSEVLRKVKEDGITRRLVGLTVQDRQVPRHGYEIWKDGEAVGVVTSGTKSPMLEYGIAMGYVPVEIKEPGTVVDIMIRNKPVPAEVVKLPFYSKEQ